MKQITLTEGPITPSLLRFALPLMLGKRLHAVLLQNCYVVNSISIQDVAKNCYVSKSTVSRFCRQIGYRDYQEMN